jgi:hypothetical protein
MFFAKVDMAFDSDVRNGAGFHWIHCEMPDVRLSV